MREIKFRGLFKGHMVHGNLIDGLGPEGKRFFQIERSDASDYAVYDVDGETVGQYTGLKDKNGKEIYEDDVLKTAWGRGNKKIKWHNAGFSAFDMTSKRQCAINNGCVKGWEIIGNIHQNPELLTP